MPAVGQRLCPFREVLLLILMATASQQCDSGAQHKDLGARVLRVNPISATYLLCDVGQVT